MKATQARTKINIWVRVGQGGGHHDPLPVALRRFESRVLEEGANLPQPRVRREARGGLELDSFGWDPMGMGAPQRALILVLEWAGLRSFTLR